MSATVVTRDRPAWGWMALTIVVCAFVGIAPQAHAFEVIGVPDAVRAALRWQGGVAVAWAIGAVPLARRWSLADREGRALIGLLALAVVVSVATGWLGYALLTTSGAYGRGVIVGELVSGALPTHMLTAALLSLVGSWTSGRRQRERAADREALLRAHMTRAELDALRERMQPHFVLNALNTVSALAQREGAEAAADAAADLGELLQFSLVATDDFVAFDTERAIVERYLAIEQARLGERLRVEWAIDPAARTTHLPALSWQPLVENAIRHDLAPHPAGGTLQLTVERTGRELCLTVTTALGAPGDPAVSPPAEASLFGGLGVGASSLERRLALLYGDLAVIERTASPGGHRTSMRIPIAAASRAPADADRP